MAFSYAPGSQTPGYSGADQRKAVAGLCEAGVIEPLMKPLTPKPCLFQLLRSSHFRLHDLGDDLRIRFAFG
jgi:hypothetical protein